MASAKEALEDKVHDRAPSRVITAEVSPEVDSGQLPIKRTAKDELGVAAGILGEEEQVTESAGEVPEDKVHQVDQRISEFHACFNSRTYGLHQERVRSFWVEWLSAEGFFRHLSEHWKALSLKPLEVTGAGVDVVGSLRA